jgi:hypothetical protein
MGLFKGGKHTNAKTKLSYDLSTICPLIRAGKGCEYCYVAAQRESDGWLKKQESDYDKYDGWVLRLRQDTVDELNEVGGIRMFSFGDYFPEHRKDVDRFLEDCDVRGLRAKAITKQLSFVKHFHDNPVISVIHVSVDNLKGRVGRSPITHTMAQRYRNLYDKVRVRSVVLSDEDMEYFGSQDWVDILTFNHAMNGFKLFSREEVEAAAKRFAGRVCCETKKCKGCKVRCGFEGA